MKHINSKSEPVVKIYQAAVIKKIVLLASKIFEMCAEIIDPGEALEPQKRGDYLLYGCRDVEGYFVS